MTDVFITDASARGNQCSTRSLTVEVLQIVFLGQDEQHRVVSVSTTRMDLTAKRRGRQNPISITNTVT